MARITIRLDDDLYDQLLHRATHAGIPCATMIRALLMTLAYPSRGAGLMRTPREEGLAATLQILELLYVDLERRAPDVLKEGLARSRSVLRDRNLLQEGERR
jgi:hypothetical protein